VLRVVYNETTERNYKYLDLHDPRDEYVALLEKQQKETTSRQSELVVEQADCLETTKRDYKMSMRW